MDIIDSLKQLRLVPIVALPSVDAGLRLAELLLAHDLPVMEVTLRTEHGEAAMAEISERFREILVIAGTVLSPHQVDRVVRCGARAIVSPGYSASLAAHCRGRDIAFFPGVCTPGEVQQVREAGLRKLKFFPAAICGGTKMLGLFRAVYPDVAFMPTGGINQENLLDYLACDNVLCCGGTWLSPEAMMAEGRWDEIESRISGALRILGA